MERVQPLPIGCFWSLSADGVIGQRPERLRAPGVVVTGDRGFQSLKTVTVIPPDDSVLDRPAISLNFPVRPRVISLGQPVF